MKILKTHYQKFNLTKTNKQKTKKQKTMKNVIYQISTKGDKVAKVQADNLSEALNALYKGLEMQQKIGKSFLSLSKSRPIFVQGMDSSGKFMLVRNIVPANWSEAQALEAINFILGK